MTAHCRFCGRSFEAYRSSQSVCKEVDCRRALSRERYMRFTEANPDAGAESSRRWRAANPAKVGNWPAKRSLGAEIEAMKASTPCADCGGQFPSVCMDFDHLPDRGMKVNNVGTMIAHGWSRDAVFTEIAKCELVCANCHRIRTSERRRTSA